MSPLADTLDHDTLAAICKALAHPVRLQIIAYLKEIDHCICNDLVHRLPLAQSTISQHLKALKRAGLIQGRVEGPCTCYRLEHDRLDQFKDMITNI